MHQVDLAGDVGEVERLLHGGVAAADDAAQLVAVEKAVAGSAARYATAHKCGFRGQAQVLSRGARGDDKRVAGVAFVIAFQGKRALTKVNAADVVKNHLCFKALGVLQKALHQLRPLYALGVGGPVVHIGGGHELTALGHASDQHRLQVGASGIHRGGIAGRAGAQNQDTGVWGGGHRGCWRSAVVVRRRAQAARPGAWRDLQKAGAAVRTRGYFTKPAAVSRWPVWVKLRTYSARTAGKAISQTP